MISSLAELGKKSRFLLFFFLKNGQKPTRVFMRNKDITWCGLSCVIEWVEPYRVEGFFSGAHDCEAPYFGLAHGVNSVCSFPVVHQAGISQKLQELSTHRPSRSTSQVLACWRIIGWRAATPDLLARLLWETRQDYTRLFIGTAFTAIYRTSGQCGP